MTQIPTDRAPRSAGDGSVVHRGLTVLFTLAVGVGVLFACGGGSSEDDDGAAASQTTTQEAQTELSSTTTEADEDSDEGDDESDPNGEDMCRLVTADEAEEILGGPVSELNNISSDGPLGLSGGCSYRANSDTDPVAVRLMVNVVVVGTRVTLEQFEQELASDEPDASEVAGVGERAMLLGGGDSLAVFDGGTALLAQVVLDGRPVEQGILVEVAARALERL